MNLKDKNILVTGGGGDGIGAGICKVLTSLGANLIINELTHEKSRLAKGKYPGALVVIADVSDESQVKDMFGTIDQSIERLHGLVNNAGIGLSKGPLSASDSEFDKLFDVDVKGVWLVSKEFASRLISKKGEGSIVNISSVHSRATMGRYTLYASAKSAVEGLTRGLALDLGKHLIRVNAIAPGYIPAQQNIQLISTWTNDPENWVRRHTEEYQALPFEIKPEDCGHVVAFLLSDLSRSVTGNTIFVDNGMTQMLYNRTYVERNED